MDGGLTRHKAYLWLSAALLTLLLVLATTGRHSSSTTEAKGETEVETMELTSLESKQSVASQPTAKPQWEQTTKHYTRHTSPHTAEQPPKNIYHKEKQLLFELNSADSTDLVQLYNIGPAFAHRIIQYRSKLGGFANMGQLWEVWGMDSARYNDIAPHLFVDPNGIIPLDVNNASLNAIGKGVLFGRLPYLFIFMVVVIIVYGWMLHSTVFGRGIYTIGGNRECARLAGVNIDRTQLVLFINSAMISVLAGVVWVAYKRMSSAGNIIGSGANYDALTAAILGGVAFAGGSGGMAGAFAAVVMVCVFYNGLTILGLPTYLSVPMQGLLLIIALILDYLVTGRSRKLRIKIKRN